MLAWSGFDIQMFIWRAIIFLIATAALVIATVMTSKNISCKKEYLHNSKSLLVKRRIIALTLYAVWAAAAIFAIWELANNNPNVWLTFKIVCYVLIWLYLALAIMADTDISGSPSLKKDEDDTDDEYDIDIDDEENFDIEYEEYPNPEDKKQDLFSWLELLTGILEWIIMPLIVISVFVFTLEATNNQPSEPTKIVSESKTLVAVSDSAEVNGKVLGIPPVAVFTTSRNGTYEYYYQDDDGSIVGPKSVDAKLVRMFCTDEGESPHLDLIKEGKTYTYSRNNRAYQDFRLEEMYYEMHIPKGSIAGYSIDLQ